MQKNHSAKADQLASVGLKIHGFPPLDQVDLAVDVLRVVHLALRARDYHGEKDVEAIADVTCIAMELLDGARALLCNHRKQAKEGGADAS